MMLVIVFVILLAFITCVLAMMFVLYWRIFALARLMTNYMV